MSSINAAAAIKAVNDGRDELSTLFKAWCKENRYTDASESEQPDVKRRLKEVIIGDASLLIKSVPKIEKGFHIVHEKIYCSTNGYKPSSAALALFEQSAGPRSLAFVPSPQSGTTGIISAPQCAYVAETCGGAGMLYSGTLELGRNLKLELGINRHVVTTQRAFGEAQSELSIFEQNLLSNPTTIITSFSNTPLLFALAATEIARTIDYYSREQIKSFSQEQRMLGVKNISLKPGATAGEFQVLTLGIRMDPRSNTPADTEGKCYSCPVEVEWSRNKFGITSAQVRLGEASLLTDSKSPDSFLFMP